MRASMGCCPMLKLLLDECMPHAFAKRLAARGYPDCVHPIHVGLRRAPDHVIVRRALEQDRVVITANADDFRSLLAKEPIHPGLIAMPNAELEVLWTLLDLALLHIEWHVDPATYMINRVVAIRADRVIVDYELP